MANKIFLFIIIVFINIIISYLIEILFGINLYIPIISVGIVIYTVAIFQKKIVN